MPTKTADLFDRYFYFMVSLVVAATCAPEWMVIAHKIVG